MLHLAIASFPLYCRIVYILQFCVSFYSRAICHIARQAETGCLLAGYIICGLRNAHAGLIIGGGGFRPITFELGVGGEGQDTSQHFEDSFGSIRAILTM